MKKPKYRKRDPFILELAAAIGAGRITIGPIHDEEMFTEGLCYPNGAVVINPVLSLVDTAVHELCHRLRPGWTERAVRSKTTSVMRQLSYQEIDKLYELVLSTAKQTREAV